MNKNLAVPNQLLGTCIVVLSKDGKKVMLGKRINSYKSGYYGLPGGRLNPSEKLIDCAKRELFEETGLNVKALKYIGVIRDLHDGYTFTHFAYLCKSYRGVPKIAEPDKCSAWEWFEPHTIPKKTLVGHRAALDIFVKSGPNLRDVTST